MTDRAFKRYFVSSWAGFSLMKSHSALLRHYNKLINNIPAI